MTGRGALRVYLGAAPGVGKTFAMLEEGHRRLERGTDVVIGYVETHGRARTADAADGIETIPRRAIEYRGTTQEEMDLDAILARAPKVVLVDELAHTNVPGSTHEKRWQDVAALRDAGIDVITTVNIQHLESLNDVTEAITGVRQRETVPDAIVRSADQIELVDMSPQALRRRMAHGNIYAADRVDAALSNYFREGNLTALRELALLWLADRVDEGLERYRRDHAIDSTWAARERTIVAVSGGPESVVLLRRAARIASRRSGGEWHALYVTRDDGLSGVAPDRLTELRHKAEDLGGSFHVVVGDDRAEAILAYARAENASQVVLGASRKGRVAAALHPSVAERVIEGSGDIDVHIVSHDYARGAGPLRRRGAVATLGRRRVAIGFVIAVLGPLIVCGVLKVTEGHHGLPLESMLLMAVVVSTALVGGLIPAIVSAVLSGLLLNLLFVPPLYTLTIAEPANAVTIAIFVIIAIAVALVVDNAARRTIEARHARAEADALTALSHSLMNATDDLPGLLGSACEVLGADGAAVVAVDAEGHETVVASAGVPPRTVADADMTSDIDDSTVLVLAAARPRASQRSLINAYAAYAAVVADRRRAHDADIERLRLSEADRTRTALLAAVSHDLRSPLAAVKASVSSLRTTDVQWSDEDRAELLATIEEATDRLTALVANLLDMSRIQLGAVTPHLAEVSLAGAVRHAARDLEQQARLDITVAEDVRVIVDPGLFDRVVANVVENSLTYTPADTRVCVDASLVDGVVLMRVSDRGPGVADYDRLFQPFQRLGDVPQGDGVGLGLAVARGLMEAMDGSIDAEPTPGGGLTFVLTLRSAP